MQSLEDTPPEEIEESSYIHCLTEVRETEVALSIALKSSNQLLEKLPESERTVVTLHYLGEMTAKEIGNFLGVSVNTIKSRLRRGRERSTGSGILSEQSARERASYPADLTEQRIMRQVADINPTAPPAGKAVGAMDGFRHRRSC